MTDLLTDLLIHLTKAFADDENADGDLVQFGDALSEYAAESARARIWIKRAISDQGDSSALEIGGEHFAARVRLASRLVDTLNSLAERLSAAQAKSLVETISNIDVDGVAESVSVGIRFPTNSQSWIVDLDASMRNSLPTADDQVLAAVKELAADYGSGQLNHGKLHEVVNMFRAHGIVAIPAEHHLLVARNFTWCYRCGRWGTPPTNLTFHDHPDRSLDLLRVQRLSDVVARYAQGRALVGDVLYRLADVAADLKLFLSNGCQVWGASGLAVCFICKNVFSGTKHTCSEAEI